MPFGRRRGCMEKSVVARDYRVLLEHLRETRRSLDVTQVDLAARLQESQSFVSKCERGERRLDVMELRQWCLALGMPVTAFLEGLEARLKAPGKARRKP